VIMAAVEARGEIAKGTRGQGIRSAVGRHGALMSRAASSSAP
jgi:hypothetical protein